MAVNVVAPQELTLAAAAAFAARGDEAPSPNHHRGAEDGTLASLSRTISGSGSVLPMMSLIDHSIPVEEHNEFHVRHEPPARRLSTAAPSHRLLRRH